jgi:uncharacterized membrane protein SpoIIM required for sporulation
MAQTELKSYRFRKEREGAWRELERLLGLVERGGLASLGARDLARIPLLYRTVVSSLSVARAIAQDRNLLAYLESLAARAYLCVYRPKRAFREAAAGFLARGFPALVRQYRGAVACALALLAVGTLGGLFLTLDDPNRFYAFVSDEMAQGRSPTASAEDLRAVLYRGYDGATAWLGSFAAALFSNNARIGIFAFALGVLGGVPVVALLLYNGLCLGAMAAIYQRAGLGADFWAWIAGHGVTEFLAVALCGGAGFGLARAALFPGRYGRIEEIAHAGRRTAAMVGGAVGMFLVAALLEGFFRQLVDSAAVRFAMGAATLVFWAGYFLRPGRRAP